MPLSRYRMVWLLSAKGRLSLLKHASVMGSDLGHSEYE